MITAIMCLIAYLLGSISSAVLICRVLGIEDPRTQGSNNPGTTNVLRIGGKFAAALVLFFDIMKGTLPVWSAYFLGVEPLGLGLVAVAACLGHIFPVFFNFQGGKAVATAFGALIPIGESLALLLIATWLATAVITRYASLAAILTVSLAPIYTYFIKPLYTIPVALLSIVIILRHKANLVRLWQGTEPKVGKKKANL